MTTTRLPWWRCGLISHTAWCVAALTTTGFLCAAIAVIGRGGFDWSLAWTPLLLVDVYGAYRLEKNTRTARRTWS